MDKQKLDIFDQKQELAQDWSKFCEISDQSAEKIQERFEKNQKLERMLQIFQTRVKTLAGIIDGYNEQYQNDPP